MAHTNCPNGHDMWNGDGKPVVWAFRVNFFRDYMRNHPECILGSDRIYGQMYDLTDGIPGEDLNCWYCDECGGLTVFVDLFRYDFIRMENIPSITYGDVENWEEYIALRDDDFEAFQDYYEGKLL